MIATRCGLRLIVYNCLWVNEGHSQLLFVQNEVVHYDKRSKLYLDLCQRLQQHHPLSLFFILPSVFI